MAASVSLCLIARDEAVALPRCLESVAGLVHETVLVDTGSQDCTRDVAARYGARVVPFPWCDDFAAARNESLRHATGDWVFWLDADEFLDDDNRREIASLFAGLRDENAAYVLKQRSVSPVPGEPPIDVDQVRLFRNHPDVRWQYRVHEQILPAVRRAGHEVRWTDLVIQHTGYQSPALRRRKLERNLRLLHLDHTAHPQEPFILFNLGWAYLDIGRPAEGLPFLRRCLERSQPGDSIIRKLYALLAQGHEALRQPAEALAACRDGLARCPDDTELLFLHGRLLAALGDPAGAEAAWLQLIAPAGANGHSVGQFASISAGLRGCATSWPCSTVARAAPPTPNSNGEPPSPSRPTTPPPVSAWPNSSSPKGAGPSWTRPWRSYAGILTLSAKPPPSRPAPTWPAVSSPPPGSCWPPRSPGGPRRCRRACC